MVIKNRRTIISIAIILTVVVSVCLLLSSYGYVTVTIQNPTPNTPITYEISNSTHTYTGNSDEKSIRKLIKKGEYGLIVKQGTLNSYQNFQSGGFLSNVNVLAPVVSENERVFIGDNPLACIERLSVLISRDCNGNIASLQIHSAASKENPSRIKPVSSINAFGNRVTSSIELAGKVYYFAQLELDSGTDLGLYTVNTQSSSISEDVFLLPDIASQEDVYYAQNYKDGFIVFSASLIDVYFFNSVNDSSPKRLNLSSSSGSSITRQYYLDSYKNIIYGVKTTSFVNELSAPIFNISSNPTNNSKPEDASFEEDVFGVDKNSEEFILTFYNGNSREEFNFEGNINQIRVCGDDIICITKDGQLEIHQINSDRKSTNITRVIPDVLQIEMNQDKLLIVHQEGVLDMDIASLSGSFQYFFDDYEYCGIRTHSEGLLLCISNPFLETTKQHILDIRNKPISNEPFDKKLLELSQLDTVRSIAPYGLIVHLSPQYGDLEVIGVSGDLGYDQSVISSVNKALDESIKTIGLDNKRYTIVNPFK